MMYYIRREIFVTVTKAINNFPPLVFEIKKALKLLILSAFLFKVVPRTRLELARPKTATRPSTWRVYQFHHLGKLLFQKSRCKTIKFL